MIFQNNRSSQGISIGLDTSRNTDNYHYNQGHHQRWEGIAKEVWEDEEDATEYEKSETDLNRNSYPHILLSPVEDLQGIHESESDTASDDNQNDRIEEKGDNMKKKDYSRWIDSIHERTLYHLR